MIPPKLSVIVPVYNVAEYLPQCLESLAAQTLRDMEVILVNDGSTDGSAGILRDYLARDPRFRLVERPNGGYSAARNTGLGEVRGEYVGFVDADDWVEPDMFEHLLALAEAQDAEIAQSGFSFYLEQEGRAVPRDNSWIPPLLRRSGGALDGAEAILLEDIAIWKKIYRRSLLERGGLTFDERMPMGEDVPFHLSALCLARKIAASDRPLYHYRKQRPGQQTAIRDRRLFAYFRIFEKMDELLADHGITRLQPWLLHLQLSRHCWGYEMAAPEIRGDYFKQLRERLLKTGVTVRSTIAPGCWRHGSGSSRLRWMVLRLLHPMALRAILGGDRNRFDRVIRLRMILQDPRAAMTDPFAHRPHSIF
ncbi:MAG: glycosyltransferase [Holophaga sp.]|nr:glycosyltransferase [Holophaga sp.]